MADRNIEFRLKIRDDGSAAIERLDKATDKLDNSVDKTDRELKGFNRTLDKTGKEAKQASSGLGQLSLGIIGFGTAVLAFRKLADISAGFLDVSKEAEGFQARLKILLGSVEEGNRLFDEMATFAGKVPFQYREIMASATALSGVMKGGVDQVAKWMPLIADLAAASGLSVQDTTGQIIRMYSAGAAAADLFRERGILAMLGFKAGVSVTAIETREQIFEEWGKMDSQFRGAAAGLAETWSGTMSMFSDQWFNFRKAVQDNGVFDGLKKSAQELLEEIQKLRDDGTLEEWAKDIGSTAVEVIAIVVSAVGNLPLAFNVFQETLSKTISLLFAFGSAGVTVVESITDAASNAIIRDINDALAIIPEFEKLKADLKEKTGIDFFGGVNEGVKQLEENTFPKLKKLQEQLDTLGGDFFGAGEDAKAAAVKVAGFALKAEALAEKIRNIKIGGKGDSDKGPLDDLPEKIDIVTNKLEGLESVAVEVFTKMFAATGDERFKQMAVDLNNAFLDAEEKKWKKIFGNDADAHAFRLLQEKAFTDSLTQTVDKRTKVEEVAAEKLKKIALKKAQNLAKTFKQLFEITGSQEFLEKFEKATEKVLESQIKEWKEWGLSIEEIMILVGERWSDVAIEVARASDDMAAGFRAQIKQMGDDAKTFGEIGADAAKNLFETAETLGERAFKDLFHDWSIDFSDLTGDMIDQWESMLAEMAFKAAAEKFFPEGGTLALGTTISTGAGIASGIGKFAGGDTAGGIADTGTAIGTAVALFNPILGVAIAGFSQLIAPLFDEPVSTVRGQFGIRTPQDFNILTDPSIDAFTKSINFDDRLRPDLARGIEESFENTLNPILQGISDSLNEAIELGIITEADIPADFLNFEFISDRLKHTPQELEGAVDRTLAKWLNIIVEDTGPFIDQVLGDMAAKIQVDAEQAAKQVRFDPFRNLAGRISGITQQDKSVKDLIFEFIGLSRSFDNLDQNSETYYDDSLSILTQQVDIQQDLRRLAEVRIAQAQDTIGTLDGILDKLPENLGLPQSQAEFQNRFDQLMAMVTTTTDPEVLSMATKELANFIPEFLAFQTAFGGDVTGIVDSIEESLTTVRDSLQTSVDQMLSVDPASLFAPIVEDLNGILFPVEAGFSTLTETMFLFDAALLDVAENIGNLNPQNGADVTLNINVNGSPEDIQTALANDEVVESIREIVLPMMPPGRFIN